MQNPLDLLLDVVFKENRDDTVSKGTPAEGLLEPNLHLQQLRIEALGHPEREPMLASVHGRCAIWDCFSEAPLGTRDIWVRVKKNTTRNWTADFGPWVPLPRTTHLGVAHFLTHSPHIFSPCTPLSNGSQPRPRRLGLGVVPERKPGQKDSDGPSSWTTHRGRSCFHLFCLFFWTTQKAP